MTIIVSAEPCLEHADLDTVAMDAGSLCCLATRDHVAGRLYQGGDNSGVKEKLSGNFVRKGECQDSFSRSFIHLTTWLAQ